MFILRTPQRVVASLRPNIRPIWRGNFRRFEPLEIKAHTLPPLHSFQWRGQMCREFSHSSFTAFATETKTEAQSPKEEVEEEDVEVDEELRVPPPPPADPKDQKIADLNQIIGELRSSLRTTLAEVDNVRKRMQKEIDKAREFGVEKLVKNMFPLLDTINICLQNKPDFENPQFAENIDAKIAFDALETTKQQFLTILKETCAVEEFLPKLGDNFDPNYHNALFEVNPPSSNPNIPPGSIGVIIKSGWKRNNTLLREASVGVVKYKPIDIPEKGKKS